MRHAAPGGASFSSGARGRAIEPRSGANVVASTKTNTRRSAKLASAAMGSAGGSGRGLGRRIGPPSGLRPHPFHLGKRLDENASRHLERAALGGDASREEVVER